MKQSPPRYIAYTLWGSVVLVVVFLLAFLLVPIFIDEDAIRRDAERQLTDAFGLDVEIRSASASFMFNPRITFGSVVVRNHPNASSAKLMAVDSVEMDFKLLPFLKGEYQTSRMVLNQAIVDIERFDNGMFNIGLPDEPGHFLATPLWSNDITFKQSHVTYTRYDTNAIYKLKNVDASLHIAENGKINLASIFVIDNKQYSLSGYGTQLQARTSRDVNLNSVITLAQGEDVLTYTGLLGRKNGEIYTQGRIDVTLSDVKDWMNLIDKSASEQQLYEVLGDTIPVQGQLEIKHQGSELYITSESLSFEQSALAATLRMSFDDQTKFRASVIFDSLIIPDIKGSQSGAARFNRFMKKLMPKDVSGSVSLEFKEISYRDIQMRDAVFSATLLDGEWVVNQSHVNMAGDTQFLLFGIVRIDAHGTIHFDASTELLGKDIQLFMSALQMDQHKLFASHEGDFRAKANLFWSPELVTLSGMRFQAGEFLMEGGGEYRPRPKEKQSNYNMSLRINGANIDSLARYINPALSDEVLAGNYDTPKIRLPWLDTIEDSYRIVTILENYTMLGRAGKRSRMEAHVAPQYIALNAVDFQLGDTEFRGDISLNQSEKLPFINADFYLSEMTVNKLLGKKFRNYPVKRDNVLSVWDNTPLSLELLKGYSGALKMRVGRLVHDSFTMERVTLNAEIDEGLWKIENISGNIWGGKLGLSGTLDVATIAAARMELKLQNIFLHQLLSSMFNVEAIRGRVSINAALDTAGVSANNLVDNMTANMVMAGSNIVIKGFDMLGLIQALPNIRSNSEVANTVRVSLLGGQTIFKSIEGAMHIADGKLKTNGLTLRSKHAIGSIAGEADLITWAMNYTILFRLPTIALSEFPELTMYFRKSMDNPLIQVDTRQLESFMTQKRLNR